MSFIYMRMENYFHNCSEESHCTPSLVPPPSPPKKNKLKKKAERKKNNYLTIVFAFSWDDGNAQIWSKDKT